MITVAPLLVYVGCLMRAWGVVCLPVHAQEELFVASRLVYLFHDEVHGFEGCHVGYVVAENPHAVECCLVLEQVIAACG